MQVWRPRAGMVLSPLVLLLFYSSPRMRAGLSLRLWVIMGVCFVLVPFLVLGVTALRARVLEKRRSKLLDVLREWSRPTDQSLGG
jgi:hypothetical protein